MAENKSAGNASSDEIDLGQLLKMIGNGFRKIFNGFLRFFLYIKKRALILLSLVILGGAIGFGLNQIVTKGMKTEVIVKPNIESKDYLYDAVDEIQANIKAKSDSFFEELNIDIENLKGFSVSITTVEDKQRARKSDDEIKYLEILQKFENSAIVADVIRAEIMNNSSLNHRITFYYKDAETGQQIAKELVSYINSNNYFTELIQVYRENAQERIEKNQALVQQIDGLIASYAEKLAEKDSPLTDGKIVLDNEERIDIKGLFELKNSLLRDTERKRLELKEQTEAVSIINFGKPQQVQKAFFGKNIVLIPIILIGLFFLFELLSYLNKRALTLPTK